MDITKYSYKLSEKDFKEFLKNLKNDSDTINIFSNFENSYFYCPDKDTNNQLIKLHSLNIEFDNIVSNLNDYQKNMIKQSFMIDEIQSTNKTENIYSTKTDIFKLINNKKGIKKNKISSIVNTYRTLDQIKIDNIYSLQGLRNIYDQMMDGAFEENKDKPDGKYFRKGRVYITNGMESIHEGFYPEENIIKGINEYIDILKKEDIDIYLKLVLSHFIIETIHPFYDGNGRFGRFLMSLYFYNENNSLLSYTLATGINNNKKQYYKSLDKARNFHSFGCLNKYVYLMLDIYIKKFENTIKHIKEKQKLKENIPTCPIPLSKTEKNIYNLLFDATLFTHFGLCNDDIILLTGASKKTVITCFNKFYSNNMIKDYMFSKTAYHKLLLNNK